MVNSIDVRRGNEQVRRDNPGIYAKIRNAVVIAVLAAMGGAFGHSYVSENKAKDAQVSPFLSPNAVLKARMLLLLDETQMLIQSTFPRRGEPRHHIVRELRELQHRHDLSNQEHVEILLNAMEKLLEQRRKEMVALYETYSKMNSKEENDSQIIYQRYLNELREDIKKIDNTLSYIRGNMTRKMV